MSTPPKRLLMVAYHFPPLAGSSGIQRTLRFVQQLPALGWEPVVLSIHPSNYERTSNDLLADVPPGVRVVRAFGLDGARHLAFKGRHFSAFTRPDRWMSWRFDGVRQGLKLVRELRPQALWSTYPIATAHAIGAALAQKTGLPWVADFRDPMAQPGYPADPQTHAAFVGIEQQAVAHAAALTFTTPGAGRTFGQRYAAAGPRIHLLENGYDEDSFATAEQALAAAGGPQPLVPGAITLLHSGIVYAKERDPRALMAALGALKARGALVPGRMRLRFRASVNEGLLQELAAQHQVQDLIELCPPVPYRQALAEMLQADGLLVMQGNDCNDQVPAKTYEYLRAGRPILGLADPPGDTAQVLARAGCPDIAPLESQAAIEAAVLEFVAAVEQERATRPTAQAVHAASRHSRSVQLAALLHSVTSSRSRATQS
jgi:glycosyltransferase involved in cell wall biosynthesis